MFFLDKLPKNGQKVIVRSFVNTSLVSFFQGAFKEKGQITFLVQKISRKKNRFFVVPSLF